MSDSRSSLSRFNRSVEQYNTDFTGPTPAIAKFIDLRESGPTSAPAVSRLVFKPLEEPEERLGTQSAAVRDMFDESEQKIARLKAELRDIDSLATPAAAVQKLGPGPSESVQRPKYDGRPALSRLDNFSPPRSWPLAGLATAAPTPYTDMRRKESPPRSALRDPASRRQYVRPELCQSQRPTTPPPLPVRTSDIHTAAADRMASRMTHVVTPAERMKLLMFDGASKLEKANALLKQTKTETPPRFRMSEQPSFVRVGRTPRPKHPDVPPKGLPWPKPEANRWIDPYEQYGGTVPSWPKTPPWEREPRWWER